MLKPVTILVCVALAHAGRSWVHPNKIFPDVKIVGGHDTDIQDHPWQVSFRWLGMHLCGGSLIDDQWVVTAAHCTDFVDVEDVTVNVGSTLQSSGGTEYNVTRFIVHPGWDTNSDVIENDIAILQLAQNVDNPNASVIELPTQGQALTAGTNLSVTGWGDTEEGSGLGSEILQEAIIPLVSYDDCVAAYVDDTITENMLCAGLLGVGGVDSCQGDSGGPATADAILYGIVSWGNGCAEPKFPGVYTNVANYVDWIKSSITN